MNFGTIGIICLISGLVSYVSGRLLLGFCTPIFGALGFMLLSFPWSSSFVSDINWILAVLAMSAIPLLTIGGIGAVVGYVLSPNKHEVKESDANP